jgi:hypothetical protein
MQDQTVQAPKLENERAEWVEPALVRLHAGSAEFANGPTDDNIDIS